MASEIKVTPENEETLEKEGPESPPLDLSDAAVMDLLHCAKKGGYVTNDQIDALLSSAEVKSEQIEDILAKFSEMGVHVAETDPELEVEVAPHEEPEEEAEGGNKLVDGAPAEAAEVVRAALDGSIPSIAPDHWMDRALSCVTVFGGTGFLGRRIVRYLSESGAIVRVAAS